jgi:molecular chaperone Hsp33
MTDRLCRGLYPSRGLRAVFVRVGDIARMARVLHGLYPTSARLFAEALAAGALLGALQKEKGRVNLQLECDGPLGGLFVDADPEGNLRGYVRRPAVHFPGDASRGAHAALGGSGYLSVLRDLGGGQHYRSAVQLEALDLAADLRRWFEASEQVATALGLAVVPKGAEPLGDVAGVLVQRLPDGDAGAVEEARRRIADGALRRAPTTCCARSRATGSTSSRTWRSRTAAAAATSARGSPSPRSGPRGSPRCSRTSARR